MRDFIPCEELGLLLILNDLGVSLAEEFLGLARNVS
jgi:hypothetical protein